MVPPASADSTPPAHSNTRSSNTTRAPVAVPAANAEGLNQSSTREKRTREVEMEVHARGRPVAKKAKVNVKRKGRQVLHAAQQQQEEDGEEEEEEEKEEAAVKKARPAPKAKKKDTNDDFYVDYAEEEIEDDAMKPVSSKVKGKRRAGQAADIPPDTSVRWTKANEDWLGLWKSWWGSSLFIQTPKKPAAQRILYIEQTFVRLGMRMEEPLGYLLMRDEYLLFSQRIRNARAVDNILGCLLLGQPGIGMSNWFLF